MFAVLNRPIVTDYVPAGKSPWILLALGCALLMVGLPRHYLSAALVMAAAGIVLYCAVDRAVLSREKNDAADDGRPRDKSGDPALRSSVKALPPRNNDIEADRVKSGIAPAIAGNVPFADLKLDHMGQKLSLHDYFFAKSTDALRPGGVVGLVTSHYTLDKQNAAVREYLGRVD